MDRNKWPAVRTYASCMGAWSTLGLSAFVGPHTERFAVNSLQRVMDLCRPIYRLRLDESQLAWWSNDRALHLRSGGRGFDSRIGAQLRNDRGQVAHTRLPRRRQSSLLYGVVKPGTFTLESTGTLYRTWVSTSRASNTCCRDVVGKRSWAVVSSADWTTSV